MSFSSVVLATVLGFLPFQAQADRIEYLHQISFDSGHKVGKTRFGGISGIVYDPAEGVLWAVTDDRGKLNPPRLYKMKLEITAGKRHPPVFSFNLKIESVLEVQEKGKSLPVFDFEGIALLPWGNLLLSSEGDDGSRPRRPPRLVDIKISGTSTDHSPGEKPQAQYVRDFDLPSWYVSEKSGKPTQGLRTNFGFEGLATSADNQFLVAAAESNLHQDPASKARLLKYDMGTAWVLKPAAEWIYPIDPEGANGSWILRGISEILPVEGDRWWVMERGLQLAMPPLTTQIYEVELTGGLALAAKASKASEIPELKKKLVLDLDKFGPEPVADNFEAMAWGPPLIDGRRLLIFASDNNFQKGAATYFVFAAVTIDQPSKRDASAVSPKSAILKKTSAK